MISRRKVRTVYLFIAGVIELMIASASSVYLKMGSPSFLLVMLTALIAIGSIVYFVVNHDTDAAK
jgi:hypothetical protein